MINFKLKLQGESLTKRLEKFGDRIPKVISRILDMIGERISYDIKMHKLSGQVLNAITGQLRLTIQHKRVNDTSIIIGSFFKTYAAIHEFGGQIMHPGGTPYFFKDNNLIFVKKSNPIANRLPVTKPHIIEMRPRYYVRDSILEHFREGKADKISEIIINQELEKI